MVSAYSAIQLFKLKLKSDLKAFCQNEQDNHYTLDIATKSHETNVTQLSLQHCCRINSEDLLWLIIQSFI